MKRYISLIIILVAINSCNGDIYDNIKEMVDSGTVYPAAYKQQYVVARSGDERVEIDLYSSRLSATEMAKIMPKAVKTVVEYADVRLVIDSVCSWVNITNLTVPNTYHFIIYTENEWGDRSISVEVRQKPFTSADKETLVFTSTATASVSTGIVNIASAPELYTFCSMRYSYTDRDNARQSGETKNNSFILNNLKAGISTVANVSCYLLPMGAIDTVWVDGTVEVKTMTQTAFDNYLNETRMFPDPEYNTPAFMGTFGVTQIPHTLSADRPCEFPGGDFDYGGDGKAWFKNGRYAGGANILYRANRGDPGCLVYVGYAPLVTGYATTNDIAGASPGDWLVYTIEVQDPGEYKIEFCIATAESTSSATVTFDALDYTGVITFPNSRSWSVPLWSELKVPIYFSAGKHKIKFTMVGQSSGVHFLRFTKI
jgi:hypothetical protein